MLATAAQASAQPAPDLDLALDGVALGLAAASDLDGDVIVVDESLIDALGVYDAWVLKHATLGNRQGEGQGPINAQEVHAELLAREVPGQLKKDTGSLLSELSTVYENLKGKSEQAKLAKDKSNNGKSDEAPGKNKSTSESSKGQQNRP